MHRNIVITGFMGAGKTTVGRILAEKLAIPFIDSDQEILKSTGFNTIPELFAARGEPEFRSEERNFVQKTANQKSRAVISVGGGLLIDDENYNLLRGSGTIVYLKAAFASLEKRVRREMEAKSLTRPLFADSARAADLYSKRLPIYDSRADITVTTDEKTPEDVAEEIRGMLAKLTETKRCLIIGMPVEKSLSPVMHTEAYKELGLEAEYSYKLREVMPNELEKTVSELKNRKIAGFSVTIPHKIAIIKMLDEIDPKAQEIGAVNTVVNSDGRLTGYNTDWLGVLIPLREKIHDLKGKSAAVIGAGGAARAAVYALKHAGCDFTVFNRTFDKAKALTEEFGGAAGPLTDLRSLAGYDMLINSIPEMAEVNNNITSLKKDHLVFDMVYRPLRTELIMKAEKAGAQIIYGYEMLLHQGTAQFKLFTGREAPLDAMRRALIREINADAD